MASAVPSGAVALGPLSLTVEGWGGAQRVDPLRLAGGTAGTTPSADDVLSGTVGLIGVSVIAKTAWLEVGLSFDQAWTPSQTRVSTLTPLAGLAADVGKLRLEVLAEYGGHRYGPIAGSPAHITAAFVGVRPGLSVRLPVGAVRLVIGAWFLARWDVSTYTVAVPAPPPGIGTTVFRNGEGPTLGVAGRLGLEF